MKVLIVEDETVIAMALEEFVKECGHEVDGNVTSGEDAIRIALKTNPDVVLMDVVLSGELDGIEAADKIQEQTDAAVIFITSQKNISDQIGDNILLKKPVNKLVLREAIQKTLEKRTQASAPASIASINILVVEDSSLTAKIVARMLKRLGHTVVGTAVSGPEAIAKANELRPDLILTDFDLSEEMKGDEVAHTVHKSLGIPSIYLSGRVEKIRDDAFPRLNKHAFTADDIQNAIIKVIRPKN